MVVIKRRITIPLAIAQPMTACTHGDGIKPTNPCSTDRQASATPNCTVLLLSACFTTAHLPVLLVLSDLQSVQSNQIQ